MPWVPHDGGLVQSEAPSVDPLEAGPCVGEACGETFVTGREQDSCRRSNERHVGSGMVSGELMPPNTEQRAGPIGSTAVGG